jgi:hypothetical protein
VGLIIRQPVQMLDETVLICYEWRGDNPRSCMSISCCVEFRFGLLKGTFWEASYRLRPLQVKLLGLPCPFGVIPTHIERYLKRQEIPRGYDENLWVV